MTLITDPDNLNDATEIVIDVSGKTVQLLVAGNLSNDGVTIKCVYSKLKELWKTNSTYIKYPFPMGPITDEQFEMINGWDWEDNTTRYLLRTGGWAVKDANGVSLEEWAGIISLGSIGASDQAYFQQAAAGSAVNFQLAGPVNQAIKVYGDGTHGNFDYRSYFKIFCRIYAKTYASSQISDIGTSTMTYQVYRFPLSNTTDIKITHDDTTVSTTSPYTGMSITWYGTPQSIAIGASNYNFSIIIDGNNGTAEQIYEFVQYSLRQATDIDAGAGTETGKLTSSLLRFVGDTLYTVLTSDGGVYIENFLSEDINRLVFVDDTGAERTFPFTAVLTLNFGDNLVADAAAKYWVYFTNDDAGANAGNDYGTTGAILVKDSDDVDMTGDISAQSSVQLTYDYDTNVQRGSGSDGEDAPITCVAIGLSTGQFVKATGTITRSTSNTVSLVAALERNYDNP
jgi:hypothetical protein